MGNGTSDVIIVGGGVIGLSLAYELALKKVSVSILEKGQIGQEASSAGAGILSPLAEMTETGPLTQLFLASKKIYPDFVKGVSFRAGIAVEWNPCGLLSVALTPEGQQKLQEKHNWQSGLGLTVQQCSRQEALELENDLSPELLSALYFPQEATVDNIQLVEALRISCLQLGVRLVCGCQVFSINRESSRTTGVQTSLGDWQAAKVVNAAGCWSSHIATGLPYKIPIQPVRGQMVTVKTDTPALKHIVYSEGCYLVPRRDGRILLGSTMEWVGYDKQVTLQGVQQLTSAAVAVFPRIYSSIFLSCWAGLRPYCEGGAPVLGPTGIEGLYFATGHFRNGLLLAPITARLMSELILTETLPKLLETFTPDRFKQREP